MRTAAVVALGAVADPEGVRVGEGGHLGAPDESWGGAPEPRHRLSREFFERGVVEVARELLGQRLRSALGGALTEGVIVETEAYLGVEDPASHAATKRGRTERNRAMWGPAGHAYVYRSYGIHWCMNVVTGPVGEAGAVLLRGLDPRVGTEEMARRREGRRPLAAGPGRLCQALGISDLLYGHDLLEPPLQLLPGWRVPDSSIGVSGRIGVRLAADRPLRFFVLGNRGVSSGRPGAPVTGPDPSGSL